jgi:hypothetical protein
MTPSKMHSLIKGAKRDFMYDSVHDLADKRNPLLYDSKYFLTIISSAGHFVPGHHELLSACALLS